MTGAVAVVALSAELVAHATGGRLVAGSPATQFTGVSIDSRTVAVGALFVAIRGDRVDGHAYITEAIRRGATGVLASHAEDIAGDVAVVVVDDTVGALQQLGHAVRRGSAAKVIAITGSAGKTSTKELIADVLATRYEVFRNRGNLNNHIGLPLSLTELASGPDIAVVELGMNHPGEIRTLVQLAEPEMRVWTNVGDAHIGHFGTRGAVAEAKAEILEFAHAETVAVVNADDDQIRRHTGGFPGRLVTFGVGEAAQIRATSVRDHGFDGTTADVVTPRGPLSIALALPGQAHLLNALAAIAVAVECQIPASDIAARVAAARPIRRRGSEARLPNGVRLIDDTYNASPAAVMAMLQAMSVTPVSGRRIAVLGEMLELGDASVALHDACGRAAARSGVDVLVAVGGRAADAFIAGAIAEGLPPAQTRRFADAASAAAPVVALVRSGDVVLIKGSRGTRTDVISDALQGVESR